MKTPIAKYDLVTGQVTIEDYTKVVWATIVDNRYKCEVERLQPYEGTLTIFDGQNSDVFVGETSVVIASDAQAGPEIIDVLNWNNLIYQIIGGVIGQN
jgi:hypothetical protein